jgi:hypothetical protein
MAVDPATLSYEIITGMGLTALRHAQDISRIGSRPATFRFTVSSRRNRANIEIYATDISEASPDGTNWLIKGFIPDNVLDRHPWLTPFRYFHADYDAKQRKGRITPMRDPLRDPLPSSH